MTINKPVVTQYFNQLLDIANEWASKPTKTRFSKPSCVSPDTLPNQIGRVGRYRMGGFGSWNKKSFGRNQQIQNPEGKALIKDICHRIELIQELSAQVPQFEVKRVEVIRQKLQEKINEWTDIQNIDENRLEQEIIYYGKIGYHRREKVRLANHCKYFLETIEHEDAPGRKIGFIAQEIGRGDQHHGL